MKVSPARASSLLDDLIEDGKEQGVQFAVYIDGQLAVDAWAGTANIVTGEPVTAETLFPVFSVTKGITSTVIHLLVERGLLAYDMRIASLWPEFGTHGKDAVTLGHVLTHTAGIPETPLHLTFSQLLDWKTATAAVAALPLKFPPGSIYSYHPKNFGWMAGEAARRTDGRLFSDIVREEIARPLGLETLHVGLPDPENHSIAFAEEPGARIEESFEETDPIATTLRMPSQINRPAMRRACLPSSNGLMNARAVARHYAALLDDSVEGVRLLPKSRLDIATRRQPLRDTTGNPVPRGLGYQLIEWTDASGRKHGAFGHDGYGGAMGFACPALNLAVGYVRNRFLPESNWEFLLRNTLAPQ